MAATDRPDCPRLEELAGLADERIDPRREAELIAHLDRCSRCRDRLEAVAADADFRAAARAAARRPAARSAALDTAIDLLKAAMPGGPAAASAGERPYADLMPWIEPAAPGIGRVGGYRLTRFLGRGSMGVVFAGREESLDRPVAVKFLNPALAARQEYREQFAREARAIAAINHPNVVTILAVAEAQGLPYLVMERVEGSSLAAMTRRGAEAVDAGARIDRVVRIARQAAAGLQAAHTAGLLHRDVKPANMLVSPDASVVKLTDFGLARPLAEASSGLLAGTPGYVSPEVLAGDKPDPRSDLFALGCVIYELLAGRPPSSPEGSKPDETARPLATVAPDTPAWLAAIVDRLLTADPAARYQTAAEVEQALAAGEVAAMAAADPPGKPREGRPVGRKTAVLAALVGLPLLAALIWLARGPGQPAGVTAAGLAAAIRAAPTGGVITIPGDGVFELGSIDLGDRDLTIRGGDSRPVLRFVAGGDGGDQSLFRGGGDLVFEDLALELALAPDAAVEAACCLIDLEGGSLRLDGCTLEAAGESTCIIAVETDRLEIVDSGLHAPEGTVVDWTPAAGGEGTMRRSIVSGRTGWAVNDPPAARLGLDHVTCVVDRLVTLRWDDLDGPAAGRLAIEAVSSVLAAGEALLLLHTDTITAAALEAAVVLAGEDNLIDAEFIVLEGEDGLAPPDGRLVAAAADRLASIAGERSLVREIPFAGDREMLRDWPETAAGDPAEVFAVEPEQDLRDHFGDDPPGGTPGW